MGGSDKGDTVKNFLKTLADNNRLSILEGVCEKFTTLMGAARGEMDLTVTSAQVSLPSNSRVCYALSPLDTEAGSEDFTKTGNCCKQIRI